MWYIWTTLLLVYCAVTWEALKQSSSPAQPCHGVDCMTPILHFPMTKKETKQTHTMWIELWLWRRPPNSTHTRYRWVPVETCRINVTLPATNRLPVDLTTGVYDKADNFGAATCSVPVPDEARQRHPDRKRLKELQAKFRVWSNINENPVLLTEVPLTLTKLVEHNPKSFWGSGQNGGGNSIPRKLVSDNSTDVESRRRKEESKVPEWVPYLKYGRSSVRLRLVEETRNFGRDLLRNDGVRLRAWNASSYQPIIYVDDNSLPHSSSIQMAPADDNKPPIKLRIKLSVISPVIDTLNRQVTSAFEMAESALPGSELDELRYMIQDERLYRFCITQVISTVHIWFDYLAFRDEIRFYRGKQSMAGVSASSVISRFVCSIIIFLYLVDGGGTSWVVLLSMLSSCAIEGWKVWRILKPQMSRSFPFVSVRKLSGGKEEETAKFDRIAMKYLSMVLYPIVAIWSIYALFRHEYTSWYSWFISNLANAVYTFGFIGMCPQLYVNYRLKSVAHLPWKIFLYKIFNTFVDDAFAWLIDMPWKHRIMTLRDDVVFLLLLMQVYCYRVDKARVNEFGYSYETESRQEEEEDNDATHNTLNGAASHSTATKVKAE